MHELSIALSIVEMAAEHVQNRNAKVIAVRLKLGRLSGVVPDALRSAFELAREQELAVAEADLKIEEIPVTAYCSRCEAEQDLEFPELCCPVCGTATPEVIRGRELEVTALEVTS
jgi:hydrogenase nickel incorporation protein HypA/HybF